MAQEYPYFKWYPKDAETDEKYAVMTDAELGFFHRCLNRSWMNEGLPADANERALALKTPPDIAAKLWKRVGRSFELSGVSGKFINPRQEKERLLAISKSKKAQKSANMRYHPEGAPANAPANALANAPANALANAPANLTDSMLQEIVDGYDRHAKHSNREPRDHAIQIVMGMNGKFDIAKFRKNHLAYCEYQEANGWNFSKLTFLGWIYAGMPLPPPIPKSKGPAKETREQRIQREMMED
jgi:hypothetical protein